METDAYRTDYLLENIGGVKNHKKSMKKKFSEPETRHNYLFA